MTRDRVVTRPWRAAQTVARRAGSSDHSWPTLPFSWQILLTRAMCSWTADLLPSISMNRRQVTSSGTSRPILSFITSMETPSRTSQVETGMPEEKISSTAAPASTMVGKESLAKARYWGLGRILKVTSVRTPRVPSVAAKRWARSYPAEDLRALVPVRTTRPSDMTASTAMT